MKRLDSIATLVLIITALGAICYGVYEVNAGSHKHHSVGYR